MITEFVLSPFSEESELQMNAFQLNQHSCLVKRILNFKITFSQKVFSASEFGSRHTLFNSLNGIYSTLRNKPC